MPPFISRMDVYTCDGMGAVDLSRLVGAWSRQHTALQGR
jgi:hypothetical protein